MEVEAEAEDDDDKDEEQECRADERGSDAEKAEAVVAAAEAVGVCEEPESWPYILSSFCGKWVLGETVSIPDMTRKFG